MDDIPPFIVELSPFLKGRFTRSSPQTSRLYPAINTKRTNYFYDYEIIYTIDPFIFSNPDGITVNRQVIDKLSSLPIKYPSKSPHIAILETDYSVFITINTFDNTLTLTSPIPMRVSDDILYTTRPPDDTFILIFSNYMNSYKKTLDKLIKKAKTLTRRQHRATRKTRNRHTTRKRRISSSPSLAGLYSNINANTIEAPASGHNK